MATITGKAGYVEWGTNDAEVEFTEANEWSLDYSLESIDATQFASAGVTAKSAIIGLADWTVTVTSDVSDTVTPFSPSTTAASLLLYYDATHHFDSAATGAYLTGLSFTTPVGGKLTVIYTFQGTEGITSLWTTGG